jgi:hypothetical protein
MKLFVCWGIFPVPQPGGHPCANAYHALRDAGHEPEIVRVRGNGIGPKLIHWKTAGRKEVEELTGSTVVPVLITDSGEAINESRRIVEWAEAHAS